MPAAPAVAAALALAIAELVPVTPPRVGALGYGTDLVCLNDLDPHCTMLDPFSVAGIRQAIYHRLCTPRGLLAEDDADFGFDVVGLLSRGTTQRDLRLAEAAIQNEVTKDDRVSAARVDVKHISARTLRIEILITPEDSTLGEFKAVINVINGAALLETTR